MKTLLIMTMFLACVNVYAGPANLKKTCTYRSQDGRSVATVDLEVSPDQVQVKESASYDGVPQAKLGTSSLMNVMSLSSDINGGLTSSTPVENLDPISREIVLAMMMEENIYFGGSTSGISLKDVRSGNLYIARTLSNVDMGTLFVAFDQNGKEMGSFYRSGTFLASCR